MFVITKLFVFRRKEDKMKVVITNAGEDGLEIARSLKKRVSQQLPIKNVTTKGCWLIISRNGPFTNEEWFPHGEVSFDIEPVEYCLDCLIRHLTDIFEGKGLHFVLPEIDFHFTIA
ncbi:MAG: hypothetical protein CO145_01875 [Candidatus Nealsonbacteria bacterium CG_4_9_14_3_um_filter_37_13]|uniref:Uncharacterized protein n=2 Tax=Candidatus Nealsoniibacteriota TaxID=1817911 RepID=A0A2H0TJR4_9BACT|nr:MAG: hypothetical protein COU43_00435 [Candidatus Nealsonbacteria bacterium CG10_big_fil_rev_8_21_14_0_10_37_25]PJA84205.1 MAG: hypothetical protein CO145_01875 [Candidatus Nealsonbacteria bacterium CG_4_9_14_3_um_filter_37_13]